MMAKFKTVFVGTLGLITVAALCFVALGTIDIEVNPSLGYLASAAGILSVTLFSFATLFAATAFEGRMKALRLKLEEAGVPADLIRTEKKTRDPYSQFENEMMVLAASLKKQLANADYQKLELNRLERELTQAIADVDKFAREKETIDQERRSETQSSNLLAHAFKASPLGLAILTLRDGCFLEVNDRFLNHINRSKEDVLTQTDEEIKLWENDRVRSQFREQLATETEISGAECQLRLPDGDLKPSVITLQRIEMDESPCILFSIDDAAGHSKVEATRLQSQKMEAVGQLAAGLAHDFNNILMIVQGYTSLLLTDDSLDEGSNQALEQVSVAADRAAQLTQQLLAFSRKQVMHPKTLHLNDTLKGMRDILDQTIGPDIHLDLDLGPNAPQIEADPSMLREGIITLVTNARDSLGKGGRVLISTTRVEVDSERAQESPDARVGSFCCLTVHDNGSGMDPDAVSRVFEPFFSTKESGKGSGLGLATVYGIIKQHNGWIDVKSDPESGTTFRVFLQASAKEEPLTTNNPSPATMLSGKERLLVVEDEPGLRALVQGILQHYGYEVITASNGLEGLATWHENNGEFDLVLTDMVMPEGLSGRELAEKLWTEKSDLKIIFTSGYSVDLLGDDSRAFVEGVNFLQKPYRPKGLAETVRRCLSNPPVRIAAPAA